MGFSGDKKYPEVLNPYQVLGLNPYYCDINTIKAAFKTKMQGNEDPSVRLAYDMLVNKNNYYMNNQGIFGVKNKDIFYYAHVGGLEEIKAILKNNNDLLYSKDNMGRTIFYIAARNGYYNLCKYLLNKGAFIEDSQQFGSTPQQSALFYGHVKISQLINEFKNQQMSDIKKWSSTKVFTIKNFDNILKKDIDSNHHSNFFKFFNENNPRTSFNNISIFDKEEYEPIIEKFEAAYKNNTFTKLERSCIGAMLGMAIGDAMGARVEFQPLDYNYNGIVDMGHDVAGKFMLKPGQWTDDTAMGLCLADSLIEKQGLFDGHDLMIRFISWWFFGYNNAFRFDNHRPNKYSIGLGGNISGSIKQYIGEYGKNEFTQFGDSSVSGNGSIIRNAPVPICYHDDMDIALQIAEKQSKVTHQGDEAAGCCQLLTHITIKILEGENLKDVLFNLRKEFKCKYKSVNYLAHSMVEDNDPNKNWNWCVKKYEYSKERVMKNPGYIGSYAMDAMAMALNILINTNSFQEALLRGVNLRGDADSLGAVIGQIAGAFYGMDGIPKDWIETLYKWDQNKEIALRGYILCHLLDRA